MSVKIMGQVWDCHLKSSTERLVLLAYADHADHEGGNIWPSVPTVAKKTGLSDRAVQLTVKKLLDKKILVWDGDKSDYGTFIYRIDVRALENYRPDGEAEPEDEPEGVNVIHPYDQDGGERHSLSGERHSPPGEPDSDGGERHSLKGEPGSPDPSLTIIKPSFNRDEPIIIFSSSSDVRGQVGQPDLMQPVGKVPQSEPPADPVPDLAPGPTAAKAWEFMLYQIEISRMVPKSVLDQFIVNIKPVSLKEGWLVVRVPNEYEKEWFEQHMKAWALRQLVGICNRDDVVISVITPEVEAARP